MGKPPRAWALPGSVPFVSLGRSQHALQVAPVLPVRRRASGGGAVLAGPWLLRAAVRLPRDHTLAREGPAQLANWFGSIHLHWLAAQGITNAVLHRGAGQEHWACFAGRSMGEVMVGGRKLAGIAQVWRRTGVLVAGGTLLYAPPWPLLCDAMGRPASEADELADATCCADECLGSAVDAASWAHSLAAALRAALLQAPVPRPT